MRKIKEKTPQFAELYEDFEELRDIFSLNKISEYINLALKANPEIIEGKFIITRALQFMGEHLKNTLESPKLSDTTSKLLLLTVPQHTRKIITSLRDSLSHVDSLSKRIEIEENIDVNYFIGIQDDIRVIAGVIPDILFTCKLKIIKILFDKTIKSEDNDDIKNLLEMFDLSVALDIIKNVDYILKHNRLKKLIEEFKKIVMNKDNQNNLNKICKIELATVNMSVIEEQFEDIEKIIDKQKTQTENMKKKYENIMKELGTYSFHFRDNNITNSDIQGIKTELNFELPSITIKVTAGKSKETFEISSIIGKILEKIAYTSGELAKLVLRILCITDFGADGLKWIEDLYDDIQEKEEFKNKATPHNKLESQLEIKFSHLEKFLMQQNLHKNLRGNRLPYKTNESCRAVIKMLVLDIMSLMEGLNMLEHNPLYLVDSLPLLIGKNLRNHLAHHNAIVDILLTDPWIGLISNAVKLKDAVENKKKIGKILMDANHERNCERSLEIIQNQSEMFYALKNGDLKKFEKTLKAGADISARNMHFMTTLHIAAQADNSEIFKFLLNQKLAVNDRDLKGRSPLHYAAAKGRIEIVKLLIVMGAPVNERDNEDKTALCFAAQHGNMDIAKILIENKADIMNRHFASPTHLAIRNRQIEMATFLLEETEFLNVREKLTSNYLIHTAVERGCLELVNVLLKNGANVNAKDDIGWTPLHIAAIRNHLEIVNALIVKGANVDNMDEDGQTALHMAAVRGWEKVVQMLVKHGASVNCVDKVSKTTPLHCAAFSQNEAFVKIVETLIENKANVSPEAINDLTPLHIAAFHGHFQIAELLIKASEEAINCKNKKQMTPLHYAASNGQKVMCVRLLEIKPDLIKAEDFEGKTALHEAALRGHESIVKFFFTKNASIDSRSKAGFTPLHFAIKGGHINVVCHLIENGAKVNEEDKKFEPPLHLAAIKGNKDIVEELIANKAEVNDIYEGLTPLHVAIREDHLEIVKILFEAGVDVNAENGVALKLAAKGGKREMVEFLLENGADIIAKDADGYTALHHAAIRGHRKIVKALIKAKVDIKAVTLNDESTALHLAAAYGQISIVKELLKRKDIDIDAGDIKKRTALDLAVCSGHLNVVKLLLQHEKVDKNAERPEGYTILHFAAMQKNKQVLEYLEENYEKKCNKHNFDDYGRKPIHIAAFKGFLENIKFFLSRGLSVNELDDGQCTPLHYAAVGGHLEVIKYLIEEGANVIAKDKDGDTAKNNCAKQGTANKKEMIKFLTTTERLIKAVQSKNAKEVEEAISEGALINANFDNETSLHCAVKKGHENIVDILLEHKANPNVYDSKKFTPLHYAAVNGNFDITKAFLAHGAIYNALSDSEEAPKDLTENADIKELLEFIDQSFENVKENNHQFLEKLERVMHEDMTMKAIMNAQNYEKKTLMVVAIQNKFEKVEQLKDIAKGVCADVKYILAIVFCDENNLTDAFEAIKNRLGPDNFCTLEMLEKVAGMLCEQGDYQKGLDILENILTKQRHILHLNDENIFDTLELYGLVLAKIKKHEKSLNILQGVYRKKEKVFGFKDSRTLDTLHYLAVAFEKQKMYDEALNLYEQIYENTTEQEIELRLRAQYNKADIFFNQQKHDKSLKIFEETYEETKKDLKNTHYYDYFLKSSHHIGLIHLERGCLDKALKIFQEISKNLKENPQNDGTLCTNQEYRQGYIMLAQQNLLKALAAFRKCYDNLEEKHPKAFRVFQIIKHLKFIFWELNHRGNDMAALQKNLQHEFFNAVSKGDLETVQYCVKYGIDVNNKYDYGRTALHLAIENGKIEIVYFLLKKKADVTQATNKGNTTLHTAVNKGNEAIVRLLLQHVSQAKLKAFLNAKTTGSNSTALHVAAKANNFEISKILLQNGAIFNAKNKASQTAFELTQDEQIKELLKTIETFFKTIKKDKNTTLNQLKTLEPTVCLAAVNARDNKGKTLAETETALKTEFKKLQKSHELNQLKKIKGFADEYMYSVEIKKLLKVGVENLNCQKTLEIGVNYLKKAFNLVEIHKSCVLSKLDNKSLGTVSKILKELEFDKKYINLDYSTADFSEQAEGLDTEIKNTKFFKLLHTELNENISSFVQLVEFFIERPIKQFLETVNEALAIGSDNATKKQ